MTLEEMLREAAKRPDFAGLTLWETPDGWQANTTNDRKSWSVTVREDVVEALTAAMKGVLGITPAPRAGVLSEEDMLG